MAEFDRGIVYKDREVIVKHTLYTDGTINTVSMGELVRCKDCKWYGYYSCEMGGNNWMRDGNGFCDRGVRKDDDHEKAD